VYHIPLSFFFQQDEIQPQVVMWRKKPESATELESQFLQLCLQYKQLEIWTNELVDKKLPDLNPAGEKFGYAEVEEMASGIRGLMGLGERPGVSLYRILEEVYYVKIFQMDLDDKGVAACAVSEKFGEGILLNKNCSRWRRNHDLAHELFHLLTWTRFRHPEGICEPDEQEEKLATCFAGNLLLPTEAVTTAINKATDKDGKIPFNKLDNIAREFDVSLESILWRMTLLFHWEEPRTNGYIQEAKEYVKTVDRKNDSKPSLFPERYRALAIKALQSGEISLGRFAKFMQMNRKEAEKYVAGRETCYAEVPAPVG
jgi:Zn-dependent peptidase ImmA (M78 family)